MLRTLTILCLSLVLAAVSAAEPLHIACIGDSITQGRGGDKPEYSYRYPFWKLLIDNDIEHVFEGSLKIGFTSTPTYEAYKEQTFSNINEGHWGWTTDGINAQLPGWVADYKKLDIALIQLGTNDGGKDKKAGISPADSVIQTTKEYKQLIDILRKKNPKVIIVFGECMHAWEPFPALNKSLKELAEKESSKDSPVKVANLSQGWVSDPGKENTCTIDWVHTGPRGDKMMADEFWKTLQPLLPKK